MPKTTGLIFDGAAIKAMLDGTMTMTHRLQGLELANAEPERWKVWGYDHNMKSLFVRFYSPSNKTDAQTVKCPWNICDQFYVKEAWRVVARDTYTRSVHVEYMDGVIREVDIPPYWRWEDRVTVIAGWQDKWRSPIYMPRWAARPELMRTITGIGCGRVQEISEENIYAEGIRGDYIADAHTCDPASAMIYFTERWNFFHARPKPVRANSKWAKALGWWLIPQDKDPHDDWEVGKPFPREAGPKEIVGYVSLPFSAEDGDQRETIQGKPHFRCVNPWAWVLQFGERGAV